MKIRRCLAEYFLIRELKNNDFLISGYQDSMVRIIGKRFLKPWEVELVLIWRSQGKITEVGTWPVARRGGIYSDKKYRYKLKNQEPNA